MILTLGAAAMPTGTGSPHDMYAVSALDEQLAGLRCATLTDGFDGAQMTG
jgi:hypothetical protein